MGRLRRSLYVGSSIEYLFFDWLGGMVGGVVMCSVCSAACCCCKPWVNVEVSTQLVGEGGSSDPLHFPPFGAASQPSRHPCPSMRFTQPLARKKNLLLCLDAFDTLYKPNLAVPAAYALAAKRHGINCVAEATASKPVETWKAHDYEPVYGAFKHAFKQQTTENPNYGRETGLGAERWWANVCPTRLPRST